ncbi:MAG: hypothetical protein GTO14_17800, partial [Anaerolineales bacterium]|nr:hypothetical protein [Anaerolineales bacterium]
MIRKFGGAEISDSRLTTTVYGVQRVITETGKGVGTTVKRITEIPSRRQSLGLKGTLGNIWDSTGGRVTKSISRVVGGISSRAQALRGSIGNSWNAARRTIAASGKSVASAISQVRQAKNLRQAASSLINSTRSGVGGAIKNISGRIVGGVSGLARQVRQVGNVGAKVGNALKSLAGRINSIRKPPTNPSFRASLNMVGGAGGLVSLAGNIGYAATGNPGWRDVADTGSVVTSATNLVGLRGTIIKAVQSVSSSAPKVAEQAATTLSTASKVASVAAKCTGVLAFVAGTYTAISEGGKAIKDYQ